MVRLIRSATGCDLTVGQNGRVWIQGDDSEKEVQTRQIVDFITNNSTISGLTQKVEEYIKALGLSFEVSVDEAEEVETIKSEELKDSTEEDKE
jgi:exosome complex component RRP4